MKQPTIIVEGNRHAVISIDWFDGKPVRASIMKNGVLTVLHDISQNVDYYTEPQLQVDLADALEYRNEFEDALIQHLEGLIKEKNDQLTEMAIEMAETDIEEPFASNIAKMKKEYKAEQQVAFGMIDTIESVKAFLEGYYDKGGEK